MPKKFKIACHLIQWEGEEKEAPEKVLREVKEAGYEGVEALSAESPERLVELATLAARIGLRIINMRGPTPIEMLKYNITLGNDAAEVPSRSRSEFGGAEPTEQDFIKAANSIREPIEFAVAHGIKPFHHAHLWTMIETKEDADMLLCHAPNLWLLFDTGHLIAARADPLEVLRVHGKRIGHVHLKDFYADDPKNWNHRSSEFWEEGRFAELGKGNMGLDVAAVLRGLEQVGYDGWISVELDRAPRPPAESAKVNREYLRGLGY